MFARSRAVSRLSPLLTVSPCLSNKLSGRAAPVHAPCADQEATSKIVALCLSVVALCRGGADGSGLTSLRCQVPS